MTTKRLRLSSLIDDGYKLQPNKVWPTYTGAFLDRSKHVSSSEISCCERRIKFGKLHERPPFSAWGYAERGNIIEAWAVSLIRAALKADGDEWRLLHAGDNQCSFVDGDQSGTPDGILVNDYDEFAVAVEFKSIDPRTNYNNLPKKAALWQIQQNMDLMTRQTPYQVTRGLLLYIDASNLQKRKEFVVEADENLQRHLRERARRILQTPPSELEMEGASVDKECSMCEFSDQCNDLIRNTKQMQLAERADSVLLKLRNNR